jgi:glyoxylase-like metal-dependent hydrolase (beta-lactamase superfamily II)
MARNAIKPYAESGKVTTFKDGSEVVPGMAVIAAPGHTVGHSMVRVSSQERALLLWGDIVHNAAVQFPEPDRAISFDTDQAMVIASCKRVFDMAANERLTIAGSHLWHRPRRQGRDGLRLCPDRMGRGPVITPAGR